MLKKNLQKKNRQNYFLKIKEISVAYSKLGYTEALLGGTDNYRAYDKLRQERAAIDRSVLDKETVKYMKNTLNSKNKIHEKYMRNTCHKC